MVAVHSMAFVQFGQVFAGVALVGLVALAIAHVLIAVLAVVSVLGSRQSTGMKAVWFLLIWGDAADRQRDVVPGRPPRAAGPVGPGVAAPPGYAVIPYDATKRTPSVLGKGSFSLLRPQWP
ncbi:hypothetical protein GCM10018954_031180 [Kutzneria kofuensis]